MYREKESIYTFANLECLTVSFLHSFVGDCLYGKIQLESMAFLTAFHIFVELYNKRMFHSRFPKSLLLTLYCVPKVVSSDWTPTSHKYMSFPNFYLVNIKQRQIHTSSLNRVE